MKNILHYSKQIVVFIACTVVFAAVVLSAFFREDTPSPTSFLSENAVLIDIFFNSDDNTENITYAQLYSLFEEQPELTVIKPYNGGYFTGMQIFSNNPNFSIPHYASENDIFNKSSSLLLLEESIEDYTVTDINGKSLFMLNGKEHEAAGFYKSNSVYDYSFVSNLYSFYKNNNTVNCEQFYIDCGTATTDFSKKIDRLFSQGDSKYNVSVRRNIGSKALFHGDFENAVIFASVILVIIIVCFGATVYIKIMIGKRSKEIFCKFLCGAELSIIRREFINEFAIIALIGSVTGTLMSIFLNFFSFHIVMIKISCIIASAIIVPVLIFIICLLVQRLIFPMENELQRRIRE